MKVYAFLKWIVSRFRMIDNYCHECGRKAEAFVVSDATWKKFVKTPDPLCFHCFDMRAKRNGKFPVWMVYTEGEVTGWPNV